MVALGAVMAGLAWRAPHQDGAFGEVPWRALLLPAGRPQGWPLLHSPRRHRRLRPRLVAGSQTLAASPRARIVALADMFEDRLARSRTELAKHSERAAVDESRCYIGFDACHHVAHHWQFGITRRSS